MLNKLISNEQNSCKSVMQSFSPLRITCSVITLGLCLTTASVGVNTAYASPVHNPARQQGVYMQSQTNLRHTSITQELPFVAAAEVRAQKHLDASRTDSANSFEHTVALMPSSPVSTDDKSVSKPSGKHFASSDANTVRVNTKSVERKNGRQGSIQNVGSKDSKDSKDSKSIQDSKLTQDVRAQNQMLFADRSAQAPYDVPFNLQYKSFSSEMTYFQKWESGRNYNHGFGAGDSYNALGAYQFDRRYGLDTFMKQVYNYDPQTFYMLSAVGEKYNWDFSTYDVFDKASGTFTQFGDDLNQAWHSAYAASPDVFSRLQDYYAYYNYYAAPDGVKRSLSYFGVDPDERSDSFKSLVWGMANLFGKGGGIYSLRAGNYWGCNKFFKLANIDGSMNDAQLITAICDAVIDNVKNIYPSQQIYWQGWINRYTDEKAHYLSLSIGSWQLDSHGWYYVDSTGRTVKGWFNAVNGKRWYADPSTGYAIFGDCVVRGYHYWIDSGYGLLYNSWIDNQDGTRMRTDGLGRLIKGWYKDSSGSCFYFDSNFKMTLGKVSVEGKDYWLDKDRGLLYNEWVKDESGKWLHTDGNGCLVKGGYHAPNGKWFYFNKDSYQMVTGKLTDDNKDYWLDENAGLLYDAWVQDAKGNWLHTDDNGVLATGWFKTKSGYWFYFNQDHTMKTGILTDKGYTFWLDKNDGLLYNEWVKDESGKWLRTDGNGCLLTGWYHAPNGKWFYFNKDTYQMVTGKLTDDNKDYWLDEDAGLLYDAWVQDAKGNWLHTDDNGVLATGWFKTKSGYWFYFNQDHTMKTGILTDKGYTFWLDKNDGLLYNEWVKDESGKWLHTDGNGCLVKGWYHAPNGKWFYFNKDTYKMVTGKLTDDNKDYWLDENAGLLYDSWIYTDDGSWLFADNNAYLVKGWYHTSPTKLFYFDPVTHKALFGHITVNGEHFYVDENQGLDLDLSDTPSAETLKRWLLKTAAGEIGYEALKDPEAGSKYGRWMAEKTDTPWLRGPSTRVWWCAIFVSWCFDQAHVSWDALPSYNCDQIYSRALNDGKSQILSDVHDCQPGDIVLYNFLGGTGFQHIGIIESNNGSTITTIEGNTSSGEAGSQHAGNGVWRRTRPFTHVRAIIRPYPFV
ncbi:VgrG-related protein [Fannyhessea vaginae]